MTGTELLDVLNERGTPPVAVAITGAADTNLRERLAQCGALAVLDKPVQDDVLMQTIAQAFAARAASGITA
jgi:FixJ family two-component response regulator